MRQWIILPYTEYIRNGLEFCYFIRITKISVKRYQIKWNPLPTIMDIIRNFDPSQHYTYYGISYKMYYLKP